MEGRVLFVSINLHIISSLFCCWTIALKWHSSSSTPPHHPPPPPPPNIINREQERIVGQYFLEFSSQLFSLLALQTISIHGILVHPLSIAHNFISCLRLVLFVVTRVLLLLVVVLFVS